MGSNPTLSRAVFPLLVLPFCFGHYNSRLREPFGWYSVNFFFAGKEIQQEESEEVRLSPPLSLLTPIAVWRILTLKRAGISPCAAL
jgi:hypothetical protein